MVRQLRSQIMNGMGFAGSWLTVKEQALACREPELFELLPRLHKSCHIAIEHGQSLKRQNHIFAIHFGQPMHLDHAAPAHRIYVAFERNNASTVSPSFAYEQF